LTSPSPCVQNTWDANQPLLLRAQGFYLSERNATGRFRWTMPESRFVFPACDRIATRRPAAIRVRAACGRDPSKDDCRVRVAINGYTSDDLQLARHATDHVVPVPAKAVVDPTGAMEIRFRGPTYIADLRRRTERRVLSFQISAIQVE
jgi:hypothetical protein